MLWQLMVGGFATAHRSVTPWAEEFVVKVMTSLQLAGPVVLTWLISSAKGHFEPPSAPGKPPG